MKQGIAVHQKLEDQVHTTVKVDIQTKEDAWGLRIWNVIQGLRTLRYTGLTRELEIWGVVDGLCVNGIIDELSYTCPDTELETSLEGFANTDGPAPDQPTISEFFKAHGGATIAEATRNKRRSQSKKVYLCDVKTRGVKRLPTHAAFRPTKIQLMLYHRLLAELATNMVDFSVLTARYDLDSTKIFSDSFLAQVSSLNDDLFHNVAGSHNSQDSDLVWSQDSMSTLLTHNTLSALWSLMITEFQLTLPNGVGSLGRVLKAEYRSRDTGEILGSKEFAMDHEDLGLYLRHEMKWWKGEREAEGVTVEEAFKCRSCDFADECEWRLKKAEEAKEKGRGVVRQRRAAVQ
jgi:exonuclease V